ncbi:hypothetical protein SDC9_159939 [bioreactor metagenome]|uniref:Uncharacterized protein n=1 Tax=bioreactor metagenome TaxID=1076179 RepID=A0A645FE09_9ZZZZ
MIAVDFIEPLQGIIQGKALRGVPGCHFGKQKRGGDGVLIPDVVADHVAVGLLVGEDDLAHSRGLQGVFLFRHEFEAGEGVVRGNAAALGHLARHVGGDDGFEGDGTLRQGAGAASGTDEIVQQKHAGLIARNGHIFPGPVPHHNAHPVGIRIRAQNEVGVMPPGQLHGQREAFGIFRIG